jgi:hypothetical protein
MVHFIPSGSIAVQFFKFMTRCVSLNVAFREAFFCGQNGKNLLRLNGALLSGFVATTEALNGKWLYLYGRGRLYSRGRPMPEQASGADNDAVFRLKGPISALFVFLPRR